MKARPIQALPITASGIAARWVGAGSAPSAHYYADSVRGSDSNDGRTPQTAFATLSAMQTAALAHGNNVSLALARGSHFRGTLTLNNLSGVKIRGYGDSSVALPKIDCSDIASNADFSLVSGKTKTYQITWSNTVANTIGKCKIRAWENGTRLKWVASIDLCEAEAGTFFVRNDQIDANATIYVHPVGDTNPVSNGKTYEFSRRTYAVYVGDNYDCRDIHTTRNSHHDGSFVCGNNGWGERILSTDGIVHNQWVGVGSTHVNCVAYDCEPSVWRNLGATLFITFSGSSGSGADYIGCYAYSDAAPGNTHDAFYAHTTGAPAIFDELSYSNCYAYGPAPSFSAGSTTRVAVTDCMLEFCAGRSGAAGGIGGSGTVVVDNLLAINCARLFQSAQGLTATDVRAYIGDAMSGEIVWGAGADISSSTFSFSPALTAAQGYMIKTTAPFARFENNVVERSRYYAMVSNTATLQKSDKNVFWRTAAGEYTYTFDGVDRTGLAAWQTATGQDANSYSAINQASKLVNDPANNDWTFTSDIVNQGGRTAGSRKHIARPDWAALVAEWQAGRIGIV